jgi:hypothetical protein
MTKVWDSEFGSHTQKLVLLALADNASDEGLCWPSVKTIARKCELTEQGVRDQITIFVGAGLIHVEIGGGRRSNRYQFNLNLLDELSTGQPGLGVNGVGGCPQRGLGQGSTALGAGVNPVGRNHKGTKIEPSEKPSLAGFEEFWKSYPSKVGKGAAETSWKKTAGVPLPDILAAVAAQSKSRQWLKDGGQYIPMPATWLNQKRWLDEVEVKNATPDFTTMEEEMNARKASV